MPVERRPFFEQYLRRRQEGSSPTGQTEPPDPTRRVNRILRALGVLLPLLLSYGVGFYFASRHNDAGYWAARAAAAASWLGFTAALGMRRDWVGAVLVTLAYAFLDAWMWVSVQD